MAKEELDEVKMLSNCLHLITAKLSKRIDELFVSDINSDQEKYVV